VGRFEIGDTEQEPKFVASEPCGQIVVADTFDDGSTRFPQHGVAARVTVLVVDVLEIIQIEKGHAQRRIAQTSVTQTRRYLFLPAASIDQSREWIRGRQQSQLVVTTLTGSLLASESHNFREQTAREFQLAARDVRRQRNIGPRGATDADDADFPGAKLPPIARESIGDRGAIRDDDLHITALVGARVDERHVRQLLHPLCPLTPVCRVVGQ
jgi:hypothetical protein